MRILVALALVGLFALVHADPYYRTSKSIINETTSRGLQRIVKELRNSTDRSIRYDYSFDKEKCWSWSISASVMSRFGFTGSRTGCRTTGTYSTSGSLSPGYTLRVLGQAVREYTTYLAERLRIWDDGSYEVVDRTYATRRDDYERYWRSIVAR